MKKILVTVIAGIMATMILTGCGDAQPTETTRGVEFEHIETEHMLIEETITEETLIEETLVERSYIDDEYLKESEYNSRVNTWDNSDKITRWT